MSKRNSFRDDNNLEVSATSDVQNSGETRNMSRKSRSVTRVQPPKLTFYDKTVWNIVKESLKVRHGTIVEKFSKLCGDKLRSKGAIRCTVDRSLSKLVRMNIVGKAKSDAKDRRITFYYPLFRLPMASAYMVEIIKEYTENRPEARFDEILQLFPPECPKYVLFSLTFNLFDGIFTVDESGRIIFSTNSAINNYKER